MNTLANPVSPITIGPATLYLGDNLAVMATLPDNSVDAVVTDPPCGIGFMSKKWDHDKGGRTQWIAWMTQVAAECLRILKPGGHALVWAIPRTAHWTATAWEDAGFEVRDRIAFCTGSGFPKSQDVGKALDRMAGVEREVVGVSSITGRRLSAFAEERNDSASEFYGEAKVNHVTAPATDAAKQWDGFGSALKPAIEDWYLLRKPLDGTIAGNVLKHGTGGLNIGACRVVTDGNRPHVVSDRRTGNNVYQDGLQGSRQIEPTSLGRFPAHFIHDGSPEVMECFPVSKPTKPHQITSRVESYEGYGSITRRNGDVVNYNEGSAPLSTARYFQTCPDTDPEDFVARRLVYGAKANKRDRDEGLTHLPTVTADPYGQHRGRRMDDNDTRIDGKPPAVGKNFHPTVKSTSLMTYLCRLITPPGGTILDPFAGSGSTGKAALLEGFGFIGIEQNPEYLAIAAARIRHAHEQPRQLPLA